ncbi:MAG: complex I NDUFA9 subunit family protein [Nitrospirota bacterium]|jgi:uncharacterized protein YbjT (DUF2867 family)
MIFIAGATGFIGTHLLTRLKEKGIEARCLARKPASARKAEELGFETAAGDVMDRESLRGSMRGAEMVVNLVGILQEKDGATYRRIHVEGCGNLLEEAAQAGVKHFFYQSALGADLHSDSPYQKTKALAEEKVKASGIPYTIFRPSLVVGEGDGFTRTLVKLIKSPGPMIPIPGRGEAKFQPLFVEDWGTCFLDIVNNPGALGKTYELGGPEHLTFNEMVQAVAEAMGVRKDLLHIPSGLARLGVKVFEKTPLALATSEQLALLQMDNITDPDAVKKNFGFDPKPFREALAVFISPRGRDR